MTFFKTACLTTVLMAATTSTAFAQNTGIAAELSPHEAFEYEMLQAAEKMKKAESSSTKRMQPQEFNAFMKAEAEKMNSLKKTGKKTTMADDSKTKETKPNVPMQLEKLEMASPERITLACPSGTKAQPDGTCMLLGEASSE